MNLIIKKNFENIFLLMLIHLLINLRSYRVWEPVYALQSTYSQTHNQTNFIIRSVISNKQSYIVNKY